MMPGIREWGCILCALIVYGFSGVGLAWGQETQSGAAVAGSEDLEAALSLEAAGDLSGAAQVLGEILEREPASIQALLAYERILRIEGRLEELLPALERLLSAEPGSSLGHQLRVRVLSELDREADLELAVKEWIAASPKLETPYREAARIWMERGEERRALSVLDDGRSRVGRADALALELGEVALALGDHDRAIREWSRAIGPDGRGFGLVRRRLSASPDGGARVVPGLIELLAEKKSSAARQRAAVELAIAAGRGAEAERIARRVLNSLTPAERGGFLIDVARRADGARLPGLAYWAYDALLSLGDDQPLAVRGRLGALALELGDTASASEHFLALEEAYETGSVERREAVAVRIELIAREGEVDAATEALARFRDEFPDAPETDRLAAILADILLDRGERAAAVRALAGASGPHSGLVRGRIALQEGDLTAARLAFMRAAPQLEGTAATETIALVTLLKRLGPEGGELLSRALPLVGEGMIAEGVAILVEEEAGLERGERAAILDFAAGLADRAGLAEEAEGIRRTIVTDLPETPEAPAALLVLGRTLGARPEDREEARSYLERLILEHPRSALVPQARRELDRLKGSVPQGTR